MIDLDHASDYAQHRDHSAAQCKNGDRLILMLVAELRAARKANEGLYRQAMAKELRVLREFRRAVWAALPTIWAKTDPHAECFRRISEAYAAVDKKLTEEHTDG